MSRLLRAGIKRYLKSKAFWLMLVLTVLMAINNSCDDFDDVPLYCLVVVAFVVWNIGREHGEGGFKNKIIVGNKKTTIFLSEMVLSAGISMFLFSLYIITAVGFDKFIIDLMPIGGLVKMCIAIVLLSTSIVAIVITVVSMIPNRIVSIILALVLVYGLVVAPSVIETFQFRHGYDRNHVIINNLLPTDFLEECVFLYDDYSDASTHYRFNLALRLELYEKEPLSANQNNMLNISIVYSLATMVAVAGIGCALFNKKDIK